jgi:hypothetical protein
MKIHDVRTRRASEKLSDKPKPDINKIQSFGNGDNVNEKSRDPSDAINKFLKNKKPTARK